MSNWPILGKSKPEVKNPKPLSESECFRSLDKHPKLLYSMVAKQKDFVKDLNSTSIAKTSMGSVSNPDAISDSIEKVTRSTQALNLGDAQEVSLQFCDPPSSDSFPPLTYKSMEEYKNKMSYDLFLEEKEANGDDMSLIVNHLDFELEWEEDIRFRHNTFTLYIPMTQDFNSRFVTKEMQELNEIPFHRNQGMFVMIRQECPWYCYITSVEREDLRGYKDKQLCFEGPKRMLHINCSFLVVTITSYCWNETPLPTTEAPRRIKIMPAPVPTSRALRAMSLLGNPEHIDLLMGEATIRQNPQPKEIVPKSMKLNESQKIAIAAALTSPITVIQGPPGTGKTATIYEIVLQFLSRGIYPIMVVAASNLAVDNIAEKFVENQALKYSVIRAVAQRREADYDREHRISSLCLHHQVYDRVSHNIKDLIDRMKTSPVSVSEKEYKKMRWSQRECAQDLVERCKVIFSTSVAAGGSLYKNIGMFPVVIMDEATQSSEVMSLIPLTLPNIEHFVFVGDHKQLNSFSAVPHLSFSLFERIIANGCCEAPIMLDTQYRMHPAISEFPRRKFYGGLLIDGIMPGDRRHYGVVSNPVLFWDTFGRCPEEKVYSRAQDEDNPKYCNSGEVGYVEKVLEHLINFMRVDRSDIGVVTPYRGQRDLISRTLSKNKNVNPEGKEVEVEVDIDGSEIFESVTIHTVAGIMISSIDAFQGREKNFIVMSCVRSNKYNNIGFLRDERRMNVALTRAKYGLVLVGDAYCLRKGDQIWRDYINFLETKHSLSRKAHFGFS